MPASFSKMEAATQVLNNVDGSAELVINGVRVLCGVNGPIEAKARDELATTAAIELNISPDVGASTTRQKLMASKIKSFLGSVIVGKLYPRQLIQINLQILETLADLSYDASDTRDSFLELSACVNAVALALMDANISLHSSFNASVFAYKQGELEEADVANSASKHLVVYAVKQDTASEILYSENVGSFSEEQLYKVLDVGGKAAEELSRDLRGVIEEGVRNRMRFLK